MDTPISLPGCLGDIRNTIKTPEQAIEVLEHAIASGSFAPADLKQCKKALRRITEAADKAQEECVAKAYAAGEIGYYMPGVHGPIIE